jgi:predicted DNA-binding protein (MmcQ/YjbR family)
MTTKIETLRSFILTFPEVTEAPHFEKTSFRVRGKILATFDEKEMIATLKLSEADQDAFGLIDQEAIHPVPNKWGKRGWTRFYLERIGDAVLYDALKCTYCEVAPKKLVEAIQ